MEDREINSINGFENSYCSEEDYDEFWMSDDTCFDDFFDYNLSMYDKFAF